MRPYLFFGWAIFIFFDCNTKPEKNPISDSKVKRVFFPDTVLSPQPILSEFVQSYLKVNDSIIALTETKVIDGTGGPVKENQTILIEGNKITEVGKISIPENAKIINCKGKTIIPGIVGTHNHTHMPGIPILHYSFPRLYLGSGVTTIQTTGAAAPYVEKNIANRIEAGGMFGPDVIHTGPYFTGEGGSPGDDHSR